jgi:hypothetical protein
MNASGIVSNLILAEIVQAASRPSPGRLSIMPHRLKRLNKCLGQGFRNGIGNDF